MAPRSEFSHRLRELKTSIIGRLAPRILSRKSEGIDGLAKRLAAKAPPAAPDNSLASELLHPDVPEILTQAHVQRAEAKTDG